MRYLPSYSHFLIIDACYTSAAVRVINEAVFKFLIHKYCQYL